LKNILFFLLLCSAGFAQTARIKGVILNEFNEPIENVSIKVGNVGTTTDKTGFYVLTVPANEKLTVVFSHITYKQGSLSDLTLKPNEDYEFFPVMYINVEKIDEVTVVGVNEKRIQGLTSIDPVIIRKIPGANDGIENIVKTLPGFSSNNELSTSYSVRGGNYDENLVYVNEIEVYRPFLIRSGQQEGLSFTNTDMVENVDASAGGFQAKYGDKMASVLDVTYRVPKHFGANLEASFLGVKASVEGVSKNQKWSNITGVRYRNNSLLVNSQDTDTNYKPSFTDVQTLLNYNASTKWQWSFLGNIAQNKYNYQPLFRQTNFGTIDQPIGVQVFYEGQEKDEYLTAFGAVKSVFQYNDNNKLKFIFSTYHTQEQEHFDILAQYRLGEVDTNIGSETFGDVQFTRGVGSEFKHARNNLDALIVNAEVKGFHQLNKKSQVEWGFKYTREDIRDRLVEWQVIDSAGFSLPNPLLGYTNNQPYEPYEYPLAPYQSVRATNYTTINRFSGYTQWNYRGKLEKGEYWLNAGVRFHEWQVQDANANGKAQIVFAPRVQFAYKPTWKKDMLFRAAVGVYNQPPFYRELRDYNGVVQPNVKAQQSIHFVLSNDYSFKMWGRGFKLLTEAYYKDYKNVNTYTIDNVRIRYRANNDATAYAYGLDARINGEFVPGTESWFTFGYLKTEENQNGKGNIARPTDQRLKFAILFQDYMPNIPNVKIYLNLVYNTGLPGGSPAYADPYNYQLRLKDYRRADAGFSYVFKDAESIKSERKWLKPFSELALGFEIFNMFNNQNAITNTWVRDVYTKSQYGIPNYMTTRVFNLKLTARL
jgi:hypothetical protein